MVISQGCIATQSGELPVQRTKAEIEATWRKPDKTYTSSDKLKYGADEVWVYKHPGAEEYLYFKNGEVIKRDWKFYYDF